MRFYGYDWFFGKEHARAQYSKRLTYLHKQQASKWGPGMSAAAAEIQCPGNEAGSVHMVL